MCYFVSKDCVDFDRFGASGPSLGDAEPERFPAELTHVGTAGSLRDVKNHWMLLEAARHIKARNLPARVHIAGEGPLREPFERFIAEHGLSAQVVLHGSVEDMPAFYRALDLFALTSSSEGHPNALLEALACRLPCITTPVGDMAQFIRHDDNGWLVDHDDSESLTDIVARCIESPTDAGRIRAQGHADARARYSIEAMVEAYSKLYETTLRASRRRTGARSRAKAK